VTRIDLRVPVVHPRHQCREHVEGSQVNFGQIIIALMLLALWLWLLNSWKLRNWRAVALGCAGTISILIAGMLPYPLDLDRA
jgi:Glycosyltransferase family 87